MVRDNFVGSVGQLSLSTRVFKVSDLSKGLAQQTKPPKISNGPLC